MPACHKPIAITDARAGLALLSRLTSRVITYEARCPAGVAHLPDPEVGAADAWWVYQHAGLPARPPNAPQAGECAGLIQRWPMLAHAKLLQGLFRSKQVILHVRLTHNMSPTQASAECLVWVHTHNFKEIL